MHPLAVLVSGLLSSKSRTSFFVLLGAAFKSAQQSNLLGACLSVIILLNSLSKRYTSL